MKRVSGQKMCRALERKGWRLARITGSHHIYVRPGGGISVSVPVHGNRTIKPGTQHGIMKAAGLTDVDL